VSGGKMKSLINPQDKDLLMERLAKVHSDGPPAWGTMSAPQMICHLSDAFRLVFGEKYVAPVDTFLMRNLVKPLALWAPIPWPHGIKGPPEVDQQVGGTSPSEFERDKQELVVLLERFAGRPASLATTRHPVFARMSVKDWMRWGYLHTDHHLRQFNC
jgi:hypothetical protein